MLTFVDEEMYAWPSATWQVKVTPMFRLTVHNTVGCFFSNSSMVIDGGASAIASSLVSTLTWSKSVLVLLVTAGAGATSAEVEGANTASKFFSRCLQSGSQYQKHVTRLNTIGYNNLLYKPSCS